MATLKLSISDKKYAADEMNAERSLSFGDAPWEASLLSQAGPMSEPSLGHAMLDYISDGAPRLRHLLTLVFAPVYRAFGYRLPLLPASAYEVVSRAYPMTAGAMNAGLQADVFILLEMIDAGWCRAFRKLEEHEVLTIDQRYFLYCCTRILLAAVHDESDERRSRSVGSEPVETPGDEPKALVVKSETSNPCTFKDVGGCHKAIAQLGDLVALMRQPKILASSGIPIPRGVLMWGPPGTGKDLLIKAFAGEIGFALFPIRGSDIFEKWVGSSGRNLRSAFDQVRKKGRAILAIDEADSIISSRTNQHDHEVTRQVVNEFLQQMESFQPMEQVLVFLITNFRNRLDEAAIRDRRIDWMIEVTMPDEKERQEIWQVHIQRIVSSASITRPPLSPSLDLSVLAQKSDGLSGAAIASILDRAVLKNVVATVRGKRPPPVTQQEIEGIIWDRQQQHPKIKHIGFVPVPPSTSR